jgi:putative heme-binding domain-containing protein
MLCLASKGKRFVNRITIFGMLLLFGIGSTARAQDDRAVLQALMFESPEKLAAAAVSSGDAVRGAVVFFTPTMSCANCHAVNDPAEKSQANVGPNLASPNPGLSNAGIVDAILHPSKSIAKGFETVQVLTVDGKVLTGVLVAQSDESVQLRDPSTGKTVEVNEDDIEAVATSELSVMPEGVAGQIGSRQAFLDLVRYLIEIRDGGAARASELQPKVMPTAEPLPEYESHIDHAGILASLDQQAMKRGEAIYNRTCVNCHGTVDAPGSLPTSLRFASGKFKNGFDPHSMYQTITKGFGLMLPQRNLVPQQKYDVIHYIRHAYLKEHNPTQFARVDEDYLASLPKGDTRGPEPSLIEAWREMDYGPNLMATVEIGDDAKNFAYKGHAIRLDQGRGGITRGEHRVVYEHDTMRVAAAWLGDEFIDYNGINFNGVHRRHPRIVGDVVFENANGSGWANPDNDSFDEVREPGRDGRFYGPLPSDWIDYQGTYVNGMETILHYRVGGIDVHERPTLEQLGEKAIFQRSLSVDANEHRLTMRVADREEGEVLLDADHTKAVWSSSEDGSEALVFAVTGDVSQLEWQFADDQIRLALTPNADARDFTVNAVRCDSKADAEQTIGELIEGIDPAARSAKEWATSTSENAKRWPEIVTTKITTADDGGPFAVDTIQYPVNNPWFCRMRLTGVDFLDDGESAVLSDWDGNVWKVTGLHQPEVTWQRIASGLFQPLGIKIRDGEIFVTCRDQLCRLHDFNGDGETDYYESFNHDHYVTDHFHEFAMGLQCDDDGNFYYAKSACHALPAIVPHHGTLLKVSADGSSTEILANGFRAANGVCRNDDGTFFVTDQEGHWNPKNRINWVRPGRFYGNMLGYHDVTDPSDSAMEPPMCWITNSFDRSPAELLWVTSDKWGPLKGSLLNMSYGYGKLYVAPHEIIGDQMQGGMCELPLPQFPTGIMRGRFHPDDGDLYVTGMYSWAGTQQADGGFYRVRYTGKPIHVPVGLNCRGTTLRIGLSDEVDPESVLPESFSISRWNIKRSKNYGSKHFDTQAIEVASARWDAEQREIVLALPELKPTWCMEIQMELRGADGGPIHRVIHNTIHELN